MPCSAMMKLNGGRAGGSRAAGSPPACATERSAIATGSLERAVDGRATPCANASPAPGCRRCRRSAPAPGAGACGRELRRQQRHRRLPAALAEGAQREARALARVHRRAALEVRAARSCSCRRRRRTCRAARTAPCSARSAGAGRCRTPSPSGAKLHGNMRISATKGSAMRAPQVGGGKIPKSEMMKSRTGTARCSRAAGCRPTGPTAFGCSSRATAAMSVELRRWRRRRARCPSARRCVSAAFAEATSGWLCAGICCCVSVTVSAPPVSPSERSRRPGGSGCGRAGRAVRRSPGRRRRRSCRSGGRAFRSRRSAGAGRRRTPSRRARSCPRTSGSRRRRAAPWRSSSSARGRCPGARSRS